MILEEKQDNFNLKKQNKSKEKQAAISSIWTKENILAGLNKFFSENNRYPIAEEIDKYEFLPSSRQIQRAFGGLKNLRKELGFTITDYSSGESRSKISKQIGQRAIRGEREIEYLLISYFGEYFVHIEKPLYKYFPANTSYKEKLRADFFIYHTQGQFAVDIFFGKNKNQINNILNQKGKKYKGIQIKTYFIAMFETKDSWVTQPILNSILATKSIKFSPNIEVMDKESFISEIMQFKPITKL